eukprot:3735361-Prymnesium_polylepis.1
MDSLTEAPPPDGKSSSTTCPDPPRGSVGALEFEHATKGTRTSRVWRAHAWRERLLSYWPMAYGAPQGGTRTLRGYVCDVMHGVDSSTPT